MSKIGDFWYYATAVKFPGGSLAIFANRAVEYYEETIKNPLKKCKNPRGTMKTLSPSLLTYEGLGKNVTTIFTTNEGKNTAGYAHC